MSQKKTVARTLQVQSKDLTLYDISEKEQGLKLTGFLNPGLEGLSLSGAEAYKVLSRSNCFALLVITVDSVV